MPTQPKAPVTPNRKLGLRFGKEEAALPKRSIALRCFVLAKPLPTCLRRPNLFPCVGKDWGEKDAFDSKTAITYRLKKGTVIIDRPFCLSDFNCRKIPSLLVMAASVRPKFVACAYGRRPGGQSRPPLQRGAMDGASVGADAHIGPAESTFFTEICGEFETSQRADMGIGPYANLESPAKNQTANQRSVCGLVFYAASMEHLLQASAPTGAWKKCEALYTMTFLCYNL